MEQQNRNDQNVNDQNVNDQNVNEQDMNEQDRNKQDINEQEAIFLNEREQYTEQMVTDYSISPKKILSRTGFALAIMAVAVLLVQGVIEYLVARFNPGLADAKWYIWAVTAFTVVGIGLPAFYIATRKIPNSVIGETIKLRPLQFIVIFFICTAAMYITNYFSIAITFVIALLKGENFNTMNPLLEVISGSSFIYTLLYAAIIAPIVEEIIFRKLMLDKLRRFGDVPAILLTGIAFGLFHMNLAQFFYATVLGMIFAYVTIRTNTIKYSILLHIMINTIGTVIAPFAAKQNLIFLMVMAAWVFGSITTGIVLFILNVRKIKLYKAIPLLEKKSHYILNPGVLLYVGICLVMIGIVTVS